MGSLTRGWASDGLSLRTMAARHQSKERDWKYICMILLPFSLLICALNLMAWTSILKPLLAIMDGSLRDDGFGMLSNESRYTLGITNRHGMNASWPVFPLGPDR